MRRRIDFIDTGAYHRSESKKFYNENREAELSRKKLWYNENKEKYNRERREKRKLNSMSATPSTGDLRI